LFALVVVIEIEARRLVAFSANRSPRAPIQPGQAAFTASGFPARRHAPAAMSQPPSLPLFALWTAFPSSDYYSGSAPTERDRCPLPTSLAASLRGFPGSTLTLCPTTVGPLPKHVGWEVPVLVTVAPAVMRRPKAMRQHAVTIPLRGRKTGPDGISDPLFGDDALCNNPAHPHALGLVSRVCQ